MLNIQETDRGYLRIVADGRLSTGDYDAFVPAFERAAAKRPGPVAMLIELGPDFAGWTSAGLWSDAKFDARHAERFGPIAVVGDKRWEKWGTEVSDPFFKAEMRFFERDDLLAAEAWLGENAPEHRL